MPPLPPRVVAECSRCATRLERRIPHSLARTAAFSLSALLLYAPANLLPILRMEIHGQVSTNTVWEGVKALYKDRDYTIAAIVLLASIVIPLLKLLGLFFLVISVWFKAEWLRHPRTYLYKTIEGVGRWAMLDVFALAILVSLVKLRGMARVTPAEGLFAFGAVVVFTLLASASFDPRLIWEREDRGV